MKRPHVGFESHQPERRRRAATTLLGGGCCCCCCCLHTVGSLLGAAIAPSFGSPATSPITLPPGATDYVPPPPPQTGIEPVESAVRTTTTEPIRLEADQDRPPIVFSGEIGWTAASAFWMILCVLSLACVVWFSATAGRGGDVCGGSALVLALVMPAVQFVSIILVAIILGFSSRPDRAYQFSQLGRVTLGTVLGTVAGVLLMILIGVVMSTIR